MQQAIVTIEYGYEIIDHFLTAIIRNKNFIFQSDSIVYVEIPQATYDGHHSRDSLPAHVSYR